MLLIYDPLHRLCAIFDHAETRAPPPPSTRTPLDPLRRYVSFRTLQPRGQWGTVRNALQELIESASPAAVQAKAFRCVGLDADALREAAEYLQLQYRKLHESEAYLASGEWERRSRLVAIKVTELEFEALSSLTEVTGLTESRLMRLALAGKVPELGRGAVKVSRAAPSRNQKTENTAADDQFVQGELFSDEEYR
ncbi:MAG: hypothetical protein OXH03_05815 [Bacteroidetes bacterium]|nr:hypothetical protein [Bacteroidota bacterium]MDE2671583.1 hypothetical protein [Bacteroidota bacterium]